MGKQSAISSRYACVVNPCSRLVAPIDIEDDTGSRAGFKLTQAGL